MMLLVEDAEVLLVRMLWCTLSAGLVPVRLMVAGSVVEAGDAVHSLYRAGTSTPDRGEVDAGVLKVLVVGPRWLSAVERF